MVKIASTHPNIQNKMTAAQEQNSQVIAAINKLPQQLSDYIAKINGTQTAEQKASQYSTKQNIQIVQNMGGLSNDQAVKRFTEEIIKALGAN